LTSLALALTWTPTLSHFFIRRSGAKPEARVPNPDAGGGHGVPPRVMAAYERTLRTAIARPTALVVGSLIVVAAAFGTYRLLGSDLLPEMDEGGFILDYIMPAGSSLTETNRVMEHVERILHAIPEVESTSRRTGLQMGLAAVTEANTGDMTVKLNSNRSRGIDEIIAEVRAKVKKTEPQLDFEL